MLERLKDLFARNPEAAVAAKPDRIRVATCALLLEVARADEEFSEVERERIVTTLRQRFDLSDAEARELMDVASAQRDEHFDLWHFTRPLNEACTVPEKIEIIEEIWRVIYADGTLDAHEDYLVHKLAALLNLNHPQLIEAKLRAKAGS